MKEEVTLLALRVWKLPFTAVSGALRHPARAKHGWRFFEGVTTQPPLVVFSFAKKNSSSKSLKMVKSSL